MNNRAFVRQVSSLEKLNDCLSLIRFKFHTNFSFVALGAISFTQQFDVNFFSSLLLMYASFNIFLYGGIYTINAITDLEKDARHPRKCNRPLPSGRISKSVAISLAVTFLSLGLLIGFRYFGLQIGSIYLCFLVVNLFYSFFAREVPYLELFVNASTMPLRMLMGTLLVTGNRIPISLMIGAFCTGIGFLTVRRIVEKDVAGWQEGRPALAAYQGNTMLRVQLCSFCGLMLAWFFEPLIGQSWIAFSIMTSYYMIFCLGVHIFPFIRDYWRELYSK
ncbi:MAG: UbiA family prenyltransferase [Leptolyngbya sp. SIO3F4]|nr:UbiA family prenyltransferase [Leptolyngbya sp. SIO3F4]